MKKRQQNMQIYFIVSAVAILCYINSLSGDFVHDDLPAIVYNRDVLGTSSITDMLLNDFWGMRMKLKESHKSYRPLTTLTFRYSIFLLRYIWLFFLLSYSGTSLFFFYYFFYENYEITKKITDLLLFKYFMTCTVKLC